VEIYGLGIMELCGNIAHNCLTHIGKTNSSFLFW